MMLSNSNFLEVGTDLAGDSAHQRIRNRQIFYVFSCL